MPTVVLDDINKRKNDKDHFEPKRWFNITCTGYGTPV